jgi:hypothetical protein
MTSTTEADPLVPSGADDGVGRHEGIGRGSPNRISRQQKGSFK